MLLEAFNVLADNMHIFTYYYILLNIASVIIYAEVDEPLLQRGDEHTNTLTKLSQ